MPLRPAARQLLTALLLATLPFAAIGQAPANPRIASLLDSLDRTKHIGPVALSPDGHQLAMVLAGTLTIQRLSQAPFARADDAQSPSVCTGAAKASITSLTWSPDSAHLAILAACGDATGVYLLDAAAKLKSARRLAELHGFAEALQYAPDGRHLGLLYVEGATRPSGALAAMKAASGEIGVEGLEIQRVATLDAVSGQLQQVTPANLHVYEFDFSPDSGKLAYIAAPPPGENNWWVAKLYTQPAAPMTQPAVILDPVTLSGPLHGLQIAVPRWSPDGSRIALIGGLMSDQGATGGDIYLVPVDGGTPVSLTGGSDRSVAWIKWKPTRGGGIAESVQAEPSLLFSAFRRGQVEIGSIAPNAGHPPTVYTTMPATIADGRLELGFSLADNGSIAYVSSSYAQAPEVYTGQLGARSQPVTHLNADLHPTWGKAESISWTNDNFPIQGWLLYPANYNPAKRYPLIVMVHGGPSSAALPRWPGAGFGAAPFSAAGYFVLEPNPRGSYGEGEAFTAANRRDFGYGDLRDILAGVDAVEHQIPSIDDHRLGLTGWSYGGFMTMFGVSQTNRFRAAVAGAGISNWQSYYGENSIDQWMTPFFGATVYDDPAVYAKSSAITFIKQIHTPTLVVVGDRDGECPAPQSFEFWHALKAQGVDTKLVIYPNEGHGFTDPAHRRDVLTRAVAWFDTHLQ